MKLISRLRLDVRSDGRDSVPGAAEGGNFKSVMPRDERGRWVRLPRTPARLFLASKSPDFDHNKTPDHYSRGLALGKYRPNIDRNFLDLSATPAEDVGHGIDQFVLHGGNNMRIYVQRYPHLGMTQGFRHYLRVDALF